MKAKKVIEKYEKLKTEIMGILEHNLEIHSLEYDSTTDEVVVRGYSDTSTLNEIYRIPAQKLEKD